ncbi:ATP-dependent DNA ligase [Candidatus Woesearchaeota archaeon]|jgi:DNA ligase 1|nr:ATP-dependent DNA ligase [Candidatus Woesearchaeota archaeon]
MDYSELANLYEKVEQTSKRLEKTFLVSKLLKHTNIDELAMILLLIQGKIFPPWDERKLGISTKLVIKSINKSTGIPSNEIENQWRILGDLGKTAAELVEHKKQVTLFQQKNTVKKVFDNLRKLPTLEGSGSVDRKIGLISELLTSASPKEATFIVRNVLEDLRVGIGEGVLRDAITWTYFENEIKANYDPETKAITPDNREEYNKYVGAVQEAFDITNDFSKVAKIAKEQGIEGLKNIQLIPKNPIKVMLYQKAKDIEDAFERVGRPAAIEFKYDGFRMQIHKSLSSDTTESKITIFTRRLEDVTPQFPEVKEYVKENITADQFIIDCEAVGFNSDISTQNPEKIEYLPFQKVSQRIKRKYDIQKMAKEFPIELNIFDIISYDGANLTKEHFTKRREILEKITNQIPKKIVLSKKIITDNNQVAQEFYDSALKQGQEGVMFKNLDGIYKPGSRVGFGVKVKPVMESLDLVIVGAEWGTGKRSGWLTSFTLACIDPDTGDFLEMGKVGTGIKELKEEGISFNEITELLKPHIIQEKGRDVKIKPVVIIEVNYEEIQKSINYNSGFALRFPRFTRLRDERGANEISSIEDIEELFHSQRSRG